MADRAACRLAAHPQETIPYLRERLRPAEGADARRLATLIATLDSDDFAAREAASVDLNRLGDAAVAACRTGLEGKPSPEARRRLEAFLRQQAAGVWSPPPERLRTVRAVELLERLATPEARALLETLARGAEGHGLSNEAKGAVRRLGR